MQSNCLTFSCLDRTWGFVKHGSSFILLVLFWNRYAEITVSVFVWFILCLFLQYLGLNSGPHTPQAGALPLICVLTLLLYFIFYLRQSFPGWHKLTLQIRLALSLQPFHLGLPCSQDHGHAPQYWPGSSPGLDGSALLVYFTCCSVASCKLGTQGLMQAGQMLNHWATSWLSSYVLKTYGSSKKKNPDVKCFSYQNDEEKGLACFSAAF